MQSSKARIIEQMNYEDVEPHLESCYIISSDERKNLIKEVPKDQTLYVIEKVIRGTEETFKNFLKALEESKDDCNYKLLFIFNKPFMMKHSQCLCATQRCWTHLMIQSQLNPCPVIAKLNHLHPPQHLLYVINCQTNV